MRRFNPAATNAEIIIGIVGKREIGDPDAVARRVREACDRIDAAAPHSAKVLLTSLAAGADTIAADVVAARAGWSLAVALPLPLALYRQDFADARDLEKRLKKPGLRITVLQPLRRPGGQEPYSAADLQRRPEGNPDRTLHYEQAGLFIAERASILLAVVSADEPVGRVGGTARSVAWRRYGFMDATAEDVRDRSDELRVAGALAREAPDPTWLIDPDGGGDAEGWPIPSDLLFLDKLNADLGGDPNVSGSTVLPVARLGHIRRSVAAVQRRLSRGVRRSVWALAALFCAAVVALELHIELSVYEAAHSLIAGYVLFVALGVLLYLSMMASRRQPLSEDYRAVVEALRVQSALWESGVTRADAQVDLRYLRGPDESLQSVRKAIGQMISATRLSGPIESSPVAAEQWILAQIQFFKGRISARRRALRFVRAASWSLFAVGFAMASVIAALVFSPAFRALHHGLSEPLAPTTGAAGLILLATAIGAVVLVGLTSQIPVADELSGRRVLTGAVRTLIAAACALLLSVLLASLAEVLPDPNGDVPRAGWGEEIGEKLLMLCAVLAPAFAGAIRFVAEKLSWEAELGGYERVLHYFYSAERALHANDRDVDAADRREIIERLAEEALRESEAWLLAHRERPLEPVVGG